MPSNKIFTPQEIAHKKFINSLRCPLCGSQLDGNPFLNIYCVAAEYEYMASYLIGEKVPDFEDILITFEDLQIQYRICYSSGPDYGTTLYQLDMQLPEKMRYHHRKTILEIRGVRLTNLLKLQDLKLDKEKFLEKIKLYSTFS